MYVLIMFVVFEANIIGDAFRKLFDFLLDLAVTIIGWVKDFFSFLFQILIDVLKLLFTPIFMVISTLFYFLYQLGYVVVLLFQVFIAIGKLIFSIVAGIFRTLAGFTFKAQSTSAHGDWSSIFNNISQHGLSFMQLDVIAYILLFLIWFVTAMFAIRILSSLRGGAH